ncbi:MAG: hypothetical protein J0M04_24720 [Verrucomicrobia bacterium]|nr:hypothetical protein [Verrucomicrobiota bacterium]
MNPSTPLDRRRFLQAGTRYVLLTALGGLAVVAEAKRRRLSNDPNCIRLWTCADCVEFGSCSKPKAQDFRQSNVLDRDERTNPQPNDKR